MSGYVRVYMQVTTLYARLSVFSFVSAFRMTGLVFSFPLFYLIPTLPFIPLQAEARIAAQRGHSRLRFYQVEVGI